MSRVLCCPGFIWRRTSTNTVVCGIFICALTFEPHSKSRGEMTSSASSLFILILVHIITFVHGGSENLEVGSARAVEAGTRAENVSCPDRAQPAPDVHPSEGNPNPTPLPPAGLAQSVPWAISQRCQHPQPQPPQPPCSQVGTGPCPAHRASCHWIN